MSKEAVLLRDKVWPHLVRFGRVQNLNVQSVEFPIKSDALHSRIAEWIIHSGASQ